MSAMDAVGLQARQVLLEVMISMAWADRELAPEERQAAHAAAISLGLVLPSDRDRTSVERRPVPPEELVLDGLGARERELVYLCAAWMALVDSVEDPSEKELLERLRSRLGIEVTRARRLEARAAELRQTDVAEPRSWWRSFDRLVVEAARTLENA